MKHETLEEAVNLAERVSNVFLATADREGLPHLTSVGEVRRLPEGSLSIRDWFCPTTLANLETKPSFSLTIYDAETDQGYQLIAEAQELKEGSILNGYVAGEEDAPLQPQVRWDLIAHVKEILRFRHGPHSDAPLE